ncbi:MAG: SPOR domain-containing protein [Alphaproteobacteria bacterium]|nr:SPOR domain-containing protein [Alphaproteobacteria bacterium]
MQQHLGGYEERDDSVELVGDDRFEEFAAPRRRWPTAVLTGLVMAVFAGGLWFFYHQGARHSVAPGPGGDVPLIHADDTPMKVKPDNPGGMPVPDQNVSVYDPKPATAQVEKLLPPPEQPLPRPVPKDPANSPAPSAAAPSAAAPAQPVPAATPAPQQQAAATPAPKAPPKPAAKETPAAVPAKSPPSGPVRIQLASLRTPEAAKDEWMRLKREHPDTLGKLTAVAVRVDLGDKGVWYRVETQEFNDPAAADRLCGDLKKQKIGCSLAH